MRLFVIENSRSAKGFIRIEFFLFVFGLVAAVIALHGLVLQHIIYREWWIKFDILLALRSLVLVKTSLRGYIQCTSPKFCG